MNTTVVRYQARPERADENEALVRAVIDELSSRRPDGVRYRVYRLADNTFVHIVETDDGTADTALTSLPAFARFAATINERVTGAPDAQPAARIGRYGERRSDA